jgi:acetamidase/formamidase
VNAAALAATIGPADLLQPGAGPIDGDHYVPSDGPNIRWGILPNRDSTPVMRVGDGATVTIDSVSHEGLLEDQGRDPVGYLAQFGIARDAVLDDARDIAAGDLAHDYDDDGPHVVTGPIEVLGAEPGDLLRVEVGVLPYGDAGLEAAFALAPFMGLVGVAPDTSERVNSIPPGDFGGNIDIKLLGLGSVLYLPVQVPGALFYAGDPHFAQGNGEVALTAFEAPLRVTYRLSLVDHAVADRCVGLLRRPFGETRTDWIAVGLHVDLDEAMKDAVRAAIDFLSTVVGMTPAQAMAYLSAAADFEVSQVVDSVKGIHCRIRKADFPGYEPYIPNRKEHT